MLIPHPSFLDAVLLHSLELSEGITSLQVSSTSMSKMYAVSTSQKVSCWDLMGGVPPVCVQTLDDLELPVGLLSLALSNNKIFGGCKTSISMWASTADEVRSVGTAELCPPSEDGDQPEEARVTCFSLLAAGGRLFCGGFDGRVAVW